MKYLLDTCVISELVKRVPDTNVVNWLQQQDEMSLFLSTLTFGEIEKGIEKAPDDVRKQKLRIWLEEDLYQRFDGRIIPIDLSVATQWGRTQGTLEKQGIMMPSIDGLIAISALVNNCIMVTRNVTDMESSGVELLNPWLPR